MTRKFKLATDDIEESLKATNDNNPHGSWSVFVEGKEPTIDFQFLDGRSELLRHAHLLHGEFFKEGKYDKIKLLYSTHTVVLEGYCLQDIYSLIKQDSLISVRENDERFINTVEDDEPFVTKIEVVWRSEESNTSSPSDSQSE